MGKDFFDDFDDDSKKILLSPACISQLNALLVDLGSEGAAPADGQARYVALLAQLLGAQGADIQASGRRSRCVSVSHACERMCACITQPTAVLATAVRGTHTHVSHAPTTAHRATRRRRSATTLALPTSTPRPTWPRLSP